MIALATKSDVSELVALHHQVFNADSHYAIYFGEPFIRRIMTWYCEGPRRFTLLARKESQLVGYICLNLGTYNDVFYSNARYAVGAVVRRPSVLLAPPILRRLRGLFTTRPAKGGSDAAEGYLALIAVAAGAGVPHLGTSLVKAAVAEASNRGWLAIATATRHDNLAAQALFRKTGFARFPDADADNLVAFRIALGNQSIGAGKDRVPFPAQ